MKDSMDLEQLYQQYAIPLKRYVVSMCHNETLAEDITADTFCRAIQNIEHFQGGRIFTWLCAIARNLYLDNRKKKEQCNIPLSEDLESITADTGPGPEWLLLQKDQKLNLYRFLQKLEPEAREVVYLRIFADLSYREIGSILGKSENWARVTFYRSKNKLKGWMEHEDGITL